MRHFRLSQRTLAVLLGAFAVAYTVQAYRIPEFTAVQVPVQPGTLPRGLGLLLLALAAALFFQRPKRDDGDGEPGDAEPGPAAGEGPAAEGTSAADTGPAAGTGPGAAAGPRVVAGAGPGADGASAPVGPAWLRRPWGRPAGLLLAICAYVALFVPLGFVLSTTLFVFGTAWYLGFANHWVSALTGGGVALALYLAMSEGLDVALPTGPLPF